jgi:hypothetical protein
MKNLLRTIQFFRTYLKKQFADITVKQQVICQENGKELHFDEYIPQNKILGTIVFTHGMTRLAYKDIRINEFCRAMASCGYRMLAPLYPRIQALDVTIDSVNDIAESLRTFIAQGYTTRGKLAVFSVSFSGAQALRAISTEDIAPHISALLALGTANSYLSTFKKILDPTGPADAYVKMLMLHNVLLHSGEDYQMPLRTAVNSAIDDAYQHNEPERLIDYAAELTPDLQTQYKALIDSLFTSDNIFSRYQTTIDSLEKKFIESGNLSTLKTPVSLIHSIHDRVLMPSESEALYQFLKDNNIHAHLTITTLMDHVNTHFSVRDIKQAWRLLQGFNFFFKHARA